MIYVFAFGDAYVKMGYHRSCPYRRRAEGFWHNVHPQALCGALDKCELLAAFRGNKATEEAIHAALVAEPGDGEFYPAARLQEILGFLEEVLLRLPLPADPGLAPWKPKKRACCEPKCHAFQRDDHFARSYATSGKKAPCPRCGASVSIRYDKLKQHQLTAKCRAAGQ